MSAYLVIVLLLAPAADGSTLRTVLHEQAISASTPEVCQRHADTKAAEQARKHAEQVRRLRGRVVGECRAIGSMT